MGNDDKGTLDVPQRETKAVQVGQHTVAIKTYLTGRESNELKKIMLERMSYKSEGSQAVPSMNIPGTYLLDQELAALGVCVFSMDGNVADLVNRLQDELTGTEYQQVVTAVNELTKDLFPTPKPN